MPTKKHDIFLSYSSKDRDRVKPIVETFETQGWKVWWDVRIPYGKSFDRHIEEQLEASEVVVVVWSKDSIKSEWVLEEANEGKERQVLIPLSIDDVRPPFGFRRIQAANLVGWKKGMASSEMQKLLDHLQRFLPKRQKETSNATPPPLEAPKLTPTIITPPKPKLILPHHEMIKVQGGTFMMGGEKFNLEKPIHQVTLSDYFIAKYPVTQALWKAIMGNNPSHFKGDKLPVEQVSWDDCQEFIKKLNKKTGENYRLPTEAESEFAARGGNLSKGYKYSGDDNLNVVGWYDKNSNDKTHEVREKQGNELGIYDMSGNVWEWCADRYGDYSAEAKNNPRGPENGENRVLRGGSWSGSRFICRVSDRSSSDPSNRYDYDGFRVARH